MERKRHDTGIKDKHKIKNALKNFGYIITSKKFTHRSGFPEGEAIRNTTSTVVMKNIPSIESI